MNISDIIQIGLTIVTFIGVVAAIMTTKWSIDTQNKQSLFDLRSKKYTIFALYLNYYGKIQKHLPFKENHQRPADDPYDPTLPLILSAIGREIDKNRIVETSILNAPAFSAYVKESIEEIECAITEIPLLFSDDISNPSVSFLRKYKKFITTLYDYGIISEAERNGDSELSEEVASEYQTLSQIAKDLSSDYEQILKAQILEQMRDEIKLQKKTV